MNWLAFVMAFQIGTSANFTSITPIEKDPSIYISPNKAFYVTMEMGANIFDFISVNGFMKSYQVYCGDIYFAPYKIDTIS